MRWTPLAACCLHASCPLPATAFAAVTMPAVNSVRRALLLRQTGRRNIVDLSRRTRLLAVQPSGTLAAPQPRPTPPRVLGKRTLFATSRAPLPSFQGRRKSSSLGAAVSSREDNAAQGQQVDEETAAAAAAAAVVAKQRASSRYIPSSYRGVRGGPKGKWKARIVSKGGLRQLGTFE